ncbi:hypothetical protein LCGC14_0464580 [marine sediment metagenome]|uniref:Uncharacterized protein n=1 Tax=marine sediment metagenome TaxID=412755 RepID=A0A0F9V0Q7_9ZZZZ
MDEKYILLVAVIIGLSLGLFIGSIISPTPNVELIPIETIESNECFENYQKQRQNLVLFYQGLAIGQGVDLNDVNVQIQLKQLIDLDSLPLLLEAYECENQVG